MLVASTATRRRSRTTSTTSSTTCLSREAISRRGSSTRRERWQSGTSTSVPPVESPHLAWSQLDEPARRGTFVVFTSTETNPLTIPAFSSTFPQPRRCSHRHERRQGRRSASCRPYRRPCRDAVRVKVSRRAGFQAGRVDEGGEVVVRSCRDKNKQYLSHFLVRYRERRKTLSASHLSDFEDETGCDNFVTLYTSPTNSNTAPNLLSTSSLPSTAIVLGTPAPTF